MSIAALRDENERLKALLAQTQTALSEHQGALAASEEARRRLEVILGELRREKFGAKSEKLRPDQYHLPLEDVEIAQGVLALRQGEIVVQIGAGTGYYTTVLAHLVGPTGHVHAYGLSKWTSFLPSNPIPNLRSSRRLLRTSNLTPNPGYPLSAYGYFRSSG
jgi:Transposase C of IS166 homeodomain/Protein-L-isoaspartate(D-aspartate) O-methyltransferase (PCMT)